MPAEDISPSVETLNNSQVTPERTAAAALVTANLKASTVHRPEVVVDEGAEDGISDASEVYVVPPPVAEIPEPIAETERKAAEVPKPAEPLAKKAIALADTRAPVPAAPKPVDQPASEVEKPSSKSKPGAPPRVQPPAIVAPKSLDRPAPAGPEPTNETLLAENDQPAPPDGPKPKEGANTESKKPAKTPDVVHTSEKPIPLRYAEHVRDPQKVDLEQRAAALQREAEQNRRRNEEIARELERIQQQLDSPDVNTAPAEPRPYSEVHDRADMTDEELAELSRLDSELPERSQNIFEPISTLFREQLQNKVEPTVRGRFPSELPWYSPDPERFEKFIKKHEQDPVEWTEFRTEEIKGRKVQVEYNFQLRYVRLGKEGTPELVGYSIIAPHGAVNELQRLHREESVEVICDGFGVQEIRHQIPKAASLFKDALNYEVYRVGKVNAYHRTHKGSFLASRRAKRFGTVVGVFVDGRSSESYYYDPEEYVLRMSGGTASEGQILEVDSFLGKLQGIADWIPIMNTRH